MKEAVCLHFKVEQRSIEFIKHTNILNKKSINAVKQKS